MNLKEYGFTPELMAEAQLMAHNPALIPARVTAVHRERYELICEYGEIFARLKTKEYYVELEEFPTTGDFVLIQHIPGSDSRIIRTLPRKTYFSRLNPTPGQGEQAVAANFDYVFVIQSLNHDLNAKRLERYLTLAWQSGAVPVVILTKADLTEDPAGYIVKMENAAPGVRVHAVSSVNGYGMEKLWEYLQPGRTIVFLGSSGVGKSSLLNALAGQKIMETREIRDDDSKGRHTTTHRQLILLPNGAMIIDTPGMRSLGMWDASVGLGETFQDVEQYLGKCKFADCMHRTEPGCAVREAIAKGRLSQARYDSYVKLKKEAKYIDDKSTRTRDKALRTKEISKTIKKMKKERQFPN